MSNGYKNLGYISRGSHRSLSRSCAGYRKGIPNKCLHSKPKKSNGRKPVIFLYRDPKMGLGMIRMIDDLRLDKPELKEFMAKFNGDEWFFIHRWIYGCLWFWNHTKKPRYNSGPHK